MFSTGLGRARQWLLINLEHPGSPHPLGRVERGAHRFHAASAFGAESGLEAAQLHLHALFIGRWRNGLQVDFDIEERTLTGRSSQQATDAGVGYRIDVAPLGDPGRELKDLEAGLGAAEPATPRGSRR